MGRRQTFAVVVGALILVLGVASCGDDATDEIQVPSWAKVAPEQIAEAKKHGVPVAFENDIGMRFVLIPAGKFLMGSPEDEESRFKNEGPQHEVTVRPFYMATTEVTNAQYGKYRPLRDGEQVDDAPADDADHPVVEVGIEDATAFLRWLSEREGGAECRLPSEAEWEYACRAGTRTRYWSGDSEQDLERVGWYFRNSGAQRLPWTTRWDLQRVESEWACRSHAVGEREANPWGLYDMHGNVWEWCSDVWHTSYEGAPQDGSAWREGGSGHGVVRGGSWDHSASDARSAQRCRFPPWDFSVSLGLRVTRTVTTK